MSAQSQSNGRDPQDDWEACPPGQIQELVTRLDNRQLSHQRQRVILGTLLVTTVLLVSVFTFNGFRGSSEPTFGGIACSRVQHLAEAFVAETLEPETAEKIRVHLQSCDHCRQKLDSMQRDQANSHSAAWPSLALLR